MSSRIRCGGVLLAIFLLASLGCKHPTVHVQQTEEELPTLASSIDMGDPALAAQLAAGFYTIEMNRWRWTARQFAVVLRPPSGAPVKGATLEFQFSVPQASIEKLKSLSLSASINGATLGGETWRQPGDYTYKRDVPPALLAGDTVRVDFELDKAMTPGGEDMRELGVVATAARLVSK